VLWNVLSSSLSVILISSRDDDVERFLVVVVMVLMLTCCSSSRGDGFGLQRTSLYTVPGGMRCVNSSLSS
jgi:hypothetical protein